MKIAQEISLISRGSFEESQEWAAIQGEIRQYCLIENSTLISLTELEIMKN